MQYRYYGSMPTRAVIYTRISRDETGEGVANQRQEEDCRKLADLRGWEVVAVEADISISGYSGKTRPAWNRVLGMIQAGDVDVVIAYHLDRLTRSMVDLENMILISEEHGVGISTVTGDIDLTTDVGRMVARILAAVARAEVERKGARQRRANEQRAAQGVPWRTGFRAFGYTLAGEVVEQEAALISEASEDVLNGTPLRAIVRRWKDLEVPTARSRKNMDGWTHSSVKGILLNPRNAGIATYKGEVVGKGEWEPIVSEETHVLLVATLTDSSRTKGDKTLGNKPRNLLSGIAVCGECGWKVEAGSSSGRMVYKCSNPDGDHLTTHRAEADEIVRTAFALGVGSTTPGTMTKPRDKAVPADLWAERERINERLEKLTVSWTESNINDRMFEAGSTSLQERLSEIEARIEEAANPPADTNIRWAEAKNFLALDLWGQRRVLDDLTEIKLWPKYRKRNLPIKQQVTVHVTDLRGRTWPALDERDGRALDPSGATYETLADVLVREQPEGIASLAKAAQWLVDNGHTDYSPAGLPGRLSPLVRYVRSEVRGPTGWTLKGTT